MLLVVSTLTSVIFFLAWIDNVSIAVQWYSDIGLQKHRPADAGQADQIRIIEEEITGSKYSGPFPAFDFLSVDLSTVSTFIPFFGFLLVALGFLSILAKRMSRTTSRFSAHTTA
jgi:hypothetical protein